MNPLLLFYGAGLGACLLISGLALSVLRWGFQKPQKKVEATFFSWLVMIPICLGAIALGRHAIVIGLMGLSVIGFIEFSRVTRLIENRTLCAVSVLLIVATSATVLLPWPDPDGGWWGLFVAMPAYGVAALMVVPVIQNQTRGQLQAVSLAVFGYIYIGWMLTHAAWLANSDHATSYLLFLMVSVGVTDVAAFLFGKIFGNRAMRSRVSPNKTWEGSIGAFLVGMAVPWALRGALPDQIGPIQLGLAGLIVGAGSQLGDLTISVIKRDLHVKDMGTLIPGHGGILDRIDSLIFAAPLFFHLLNYFEAL